MTWDLAQIALDQAHQAVDYAIVAYALTFVLLLVYGKNRGVER